MLKPEKPYAFKKELLQIHKKGLRNRELHPPGR